MCEVFKPIEREKKGVAPIGSEEEVWPSGRESLYGRGREKKIFAYFNFQKIN